MHALRVSAFNCDRNRDPDCAPAFPDQVAHSIRKRRFHQVFFVIGNRWIVCLFSNLLAHFQVPLAAASNIPVRMPLRAPVTFEGSMSSQRAATIAMPAGSTFAR